MDPENIKTVPNSTEDSDHASRFICYACNNETFLPVRTLSPVSVVKTECNGCGDETIHRAVGTTPIDKRTGTGG